MTTRYSRETRGTLLKIREASGAINRPENERAPGLLEQHNVASRAFSPSLWRTALAVNAERQQGEILLAWERLAALTGHHDLAENAGFELPETLTRLPRRQGTPGPEAQELRQHLLEVLEAADSINQHEGDDALLQEHNERLRERITLAWKRLAISTGNHRTLLTEDEEQPLVNFLILGQDPLRLLGAAAFHLEASLSGYRALQEGPSPSPDNLLQMAEHNGRMAHRFLWAVTDLGNTDEKRRETLRACCCRGQSELNQARRQAHRRLGLEPPPTGTPGRWTQTEPRPPLLPVAAAPRRDGDAGRAGSDPARSRKQQRRSQ